MKEYKTPFNSFIGGYYIDTKICDMIVQFFKDNKSKAGPGVSYDNNVSSVNKDKKDSTELCVSNTYIEQPFFQYRTALQSCLDEYVKKYNEAAACSHYDVESHYNLQHYAPGGGFKQWHHESTCKVSALRKLVFMTYLNNVPKGGTEFKYQKLITPCEKGLTVIWPAEFTHAHKGVISKDKEKYIVTGWFRYSER